MYFVKIKHRRGYSYLGHVDKMAHACCLFKATSYTTLKEAENSSCDCQDFWKPFFHHKTEIVQCK